MLVFVREKAMPFFPVGEAKFWSCRRHIPARQRFPDLFGPVADIHHVEGVCGMSTFVLVTCVV
jgi:hypothetical protein